MPLKEKRDPNTNEIFIINEVGEVVGEKDEKTGKTVFYKDQPPDVIQGLTPPVQPVETQESRLPHLSAAHQFREVAGKHIPSFIRFGAALGGATMGQRALGALGGVGTSMLLQEAAPDLFGPYNPALGNNPLGFAVDAGTEIAGNEAMTRLAQGATYALSPSTRQHLKDYLFQRWFTKSKSIDPEILRAQPGLPDPNLVTTQVNENARRAAEFLASEPYRVKISQQRGEVDPFFRALRQVDPNDLMRTAQQETEAHARALFRARSDAYAPLNEFKDKNTLNVVIPRKKLVPDPTHPLGAPKEVTVFEPESIRGAIPLTQSAAFAEELGKNVDSLLGPDAIRTASFAPGTGSMLARLKTELDKVRGVKTALDANTHEPLAQPFIDYDALLTLRHTIDEFRKLHAGEPVLNFLESNLKTLSRTLKNDMNEGVALWGPHAQSIQAAGDAAHIKAVDTVTPKMVKDVRTAQVQNKDLAYETVAKEALTNADKMKQFLEGGQNLNTARAVFNREMSHQMFDNVRGIHDPAAALNWLHDHETVAKVLYSDAERLQMTRFLRKLEQVKDVSPVAGTAMSLTRMRAGISLISNLTNPAGNIEYSLGLILGPVGGRRFVEKVLFDKRYSQLAMQLMDAAPQSARAKVLMKTVLAGLKGTQVYKMEPDGSKSPYFVGEGGTLQRLPQEIDENKILAESAPPTDVTRPINILQGLR